MPIGAWITSLVLDIGSRVRHAGALARGAWWAIAVGVIGALAAAVFGLLDLLDIPRRTRAFRVGLIHMTLNLLVVAAFVVSFIWRDDRGVSVETSIGQIVLSAAALVFLGVSGFLGGMLAYRYGVRVAAETDQAEGYRSRRTPKRRHPRRCHAQLSSRRAVLGGVRIGWSDRDRATPGVTDAHGRPHPRQRRRPHRRAAVTAPSTSKDHVPAKYKERVPRVIRRDDGTDAWLIEGQEIATLRSQRGAGPSAARAGAADPASFDQVRPGTYDVHERIRDMNVNGVLASLNFPSWPGLGGQFFVQSDDTEFVEVMIRAYNDWHIDEWCGAYPGRFIPLALSRLHARRRVDGRRDPPRRREGLPRGLVPLRAAPLRHCPTTTATSGTRRGRRATTPAP